MKKIILSISLSFSALVFCACANKSLIKTGNQPLKNAVYANDHISLAPYTGLEAEKAVYSVSEENIENAIHEQLSDYAKYKSVSRVSQDRDWVYFDYTAQIDGEVVSESSDGEYYVILGDAEFGDEFDQKITGVEKGDAMVFDIDYDNNYENDSDWAGKTVHFSLTITDIQEEILPEVTDAFLENHFGCSSYDEFVEDTKKSLEESYAEESMDNLKENLLVQVVDASSILAYEKQEYEDAYNLAVSEYEEYAEMFGMELEEIYDFMGVTEEELKDSATQILYREIVQDAIVENEHITLTEAEYKDGLEYYAYLNDYDSPEALLEDFSEEELQTQLKQDKVLDFLVENAQITEVTTEHTDN